jgi:hypothetical protein
VYTLRRLRMSWTLCLSLLNRKVGEIVAEQFRYLPAFGRFLIVVTFLEDAVRILSQWSDQIYYLGTYRKIPWGLSHLFLLIVAGHVKW